MFSRKDHRLGHKTSLSKFKKTAIIPSIFLNHNVMKLEINNEENWKIHEYVEMKHHTIEQPTGQRRKLKRKNTLRQMKMEIQYTKPVGGSKSTSNRKVYSDKPLH